MKNIDALLTVILFIVLLVILVAYHVLVPVCDRSTRYITARQLRECMIQKDVVE